MTTAPAPLVNGPLTGPRPAPPRRLPALDLVHTPAGARRMATVMVLALALLPFGLVFLPWQMSLSAAGRVAAFDPAERRQTVEAVVGGRVLKWHVVEGQEVTGPVMAKRTVLKPEDLVVVSGPAAGTEKDGDRVLVETVDDNDRPVTEERVIDTRRGDRLAVEDRMARPGSLIVSIRDANPNLVNDLAQERRATRERLTQARERVASFDRQIASLRAAQKEAIRGAEKRLEGARNRLESARQSLRVAEENQAANVAAFKIQDDLLKQGLAAGLTWVEAKRRRDAGAAEVVRAQASRDEAGANVEAAEADLARVRNDTEAAIRNVEALRQGAEADAFAAQTALVQIRVRQRRQDVQDVTAPCDGVVQQVLANTGPGGVTVKDGDPLVVIVPKIPEGKPRRQVAELFLDGNDAPQVMRQWERLRQAGAEAPSIPVRLAFEGYPAVQWVGWPSLAVGTFAGRVVFVDPHADGKGQFRVLVEPDPDGEPWPADFNLRQGNRVNAFVLLDRVPLWWELWRRLNGFPPVLADDIKDEKPAKPRLPK